MKKIALSLALIAISGLTSSIPAGHAARTRPQPGSTPTTSKPVSIGQFATLCSAGQAIADSRNIIQNNRNVQVVHLAASNYSAASAVLQNLNNATIKQNVYFSVQTGNAEYLRIVVEYFPEKAFVNPQIIDFVAPVTKVPPQFGKAKLFANGNGNFEIPIDRQGFNQGIPANAKISSIAFQQLGNFSDCTVQVTEFNYVIFNGKLAPIDSSSPSSTCTMTCTPTAR